MRKTIKMQRTPEVIDKQIELMNTMGWNFILQHGTYTSKMHTPNGVITFTTIEFSNKVFVAANKVKTDCLNTEIGQKIIKTKHLKKNYANTNIHDHIESPICFNIDIKGAYASCLYNSGLITLPTYDYLLTLNKEERLPAVGMLAKSHIKYFYEDGKCIKVEPFRSPTAELFFFLIQKIDEIMREIKWILGKYFIFYWVDGVFFSWDTPDKLIDKVKDYLTSLNYRFTMVDVHNFEYKNEAGNCVVKMHKDNEDKVYQFRSSNADDEYFKRLLYNKSQRK